MSARIRDTGPRRCGVGALAMAVLLAAALAPSEAWAGFVGQQRVASGLFQPLGATFAPGDPTRLFIITKPGVIRILNLATGVLEATPFLTIPDATNEFPEGGLLGIAFAPDYMTSGKFYVNVTVDNNSGVIVAGEPSPFDTMIREYTVSANPNVANPTPRTILSFAQPREWHNGGWIGFSPRDGYLYAGVGDGGFGAAPNAQTNLLGSILRVNVNADDFPADGAQNYGIPADNPFVGAPERDELWATGLRNPWRASFDRSTHDLWIGDVGNALFEEINFQAAGATGGANYGWPLREGTQQGPGANGGPMPAGGVDPVYEYQHPSGPTDFDPFKGYSVVGGFVYRGPDPTLRGKYIFGDVNQRRMWMFDPSNPQATVERIDDELPLDVGSGGYGVSFAEDYDGNLYAVYLGSGEVYRLVTDTLAPGDFNGDGYVDADDLSRWRTHAGLTVGAGWGDGDADGDFDVDGADLLIWQRQVGVSPLVVNPTTVAAPEPAGVALSFTCVLAWGECARRRRLVANRFVA